MSPQPSEAGSAALAALTGTHYELAFSPPACPLKTQADVSARADLSREAGRDDEADERAAKRVKLEHADEDDEEEVDELLDELEEDAPIQPATSFPSVHTPPLERRAGDHAPNRYFSPSAAVLCGISSPAQSRSATPAAPSSGQPNNLYPPATPQPRPVLRRPWTDEEDEVLVQGRLRGESYHDLAARFERTPGAVEQHWRIVRKIRGLVGRPALSSTTSPQWAVTHPETSQSTVDTPPVSRSSTPTATPVSAGRRVNWTAAEDIAMAELRAQNFRWKDIAARLGRTEKAVLHRWYNVLRPKNAAEQASPDSAVMQQSPTVINPASTSPAPSAPFPGPSLAATLCAAPAAPSSHPHPAHLPMRRVKLRTWGKDEFAQALGALRRLREPW